MSKLVQKWRRLKMTIMLFNKEKTTLTQENIVSN